MNSIETTTVTTKSLNPISSIEVLPTTPSKNKVAHSTTVENSSTSTDDDSYVTVTDDGKGTFYQY